MVINIPLTYLIFDFMASKAIEGAAYGTILSSFVSFVAMLSFTSNEKNIERFVNQSMRFDAELFKTFLRYGLPSGLETFLNVAAFNLFVLLFQSYGSDEGAAVTIFSIGILYVSYLS